MDHDEVDAVRLARLEGKKFRKKKKYELVIFKKKGKKDRNFL